MLAGVVVSCQESLQTSGASCSCCACSWTATSARRSGRAPRPCTDQCSRTWLPRPYIRLAGVLTHLPAPGPSISAPGKTSKGTGSGQPRAPGFKQEVNRLRELEEAKHQGQRRPHADQPDEARACPCHRPDPSPLCKSLPLPPPRPPLLSARDGPLCLAHPSAAPPSHLLFPKASVSIALVSLGLSPPHPPSSVSLSLM
nr:HSPC234 [Homo sapiens]